MFPETLVTLICTFDQSGSCCPDAALPPKSSPASNANTATPAILKNSIPRRISSLLSETAAHCITPFLLPIKKRFLGSWVLGFLPFALQRPRVVCPGALECGNPPAAFPSSAMRREGQNLIPASHPVSASGLET